MDFEISFEYTDGRPSCVKRVRVAGRRTVDFMASGGQGFLQLQRYLMDELGEPTGLVMGGGRDELFRSHLGTATVRAIDAADDNSVEVLPSLILPFRLSVPAGILRKAIDDAVLILRLGAISNALLTVLGWNVRDATPGPTRSRDLVHVTLIVASYVNELRVILEKAKPSSTRIWELAERGVQAGRQLPWESVQKCRELLDWNNPLQQRVEFIRNKFGFHLTPVAFDKWLKSKASDEQVVMQAVEDPRRSDVIFVASAQAIADACKQPDDAEFFGLATALATTLPYLVEATLIGLIVEQGFEPTRFLALDVEGALKGRSRWSAERSESPHAD